MARIGLEPQWSARSMIAGSWKGGDYETIIVTLLAMAGRQPRRNNTASNCVASLQTLSAVHALFLPKAFRV